MSKVEFSMDNIKKCRCPECPVQEKSECVKKRMEMMKDMSMDKMPDPKMMIGMYCAQAVGKATCTDLDSNQSCICSSCAVWQENNLKSSYYCLKGSADEIDA